MVEEIMPEGKSLAQEAGGSLGATMIKEVC